MATTTLKRQQLALEVGRVELIPPGRPLTAEEIARLDELAERLRRAFFGNRSEDYVDLLRRVSAVRTGKRSAGAPMVSPNPYRDEIACLLRRARCHYGATLLYDEAGLSVEEDARQLSRSVNQVNNCRRGVHRVLDGVLAANKTQPGYDEAILRASARLATRGRQFAHGEFYRGGVPEAAQAPLGVVV